ncbi:MAG: glycosyl hydrolase [Dermatophilaceae bacterium]
MSLVRLVVASAACLALLGCAGAPEVPRHTESAATTTSPLQDRDARFGLPKDPDSSRTSLSGVWLGGRMSTGDLEQFATWRGARVETVTTYVAYDTWADMKNAWTISTFDGFPGTLVYGLALLPTREKGSLQDVVDGKHDDVWHAVAANLRLHSRQRSIVRIGLEANGTWFPWGATAVTAQTFKDAYRRVAGILRQQLPEVLLGFDITCAVGLKGDADRLAPLTVLYPGDDVVDIVGCDIYDDRSHDVSGGQYQALTRFAKGPGLLDIADFARARGKPMAVPEWGLDAVLGKKDNPDFISAMHRFFVDHPGEVLFENYFNEPGTTLKSSLWDPVNNPESSRVYRSLWRTDETG